MAKTNRFVIILINMGECVLASFPLLVLKLGNDVLVSDRNWSGFLERGLPSIDKLILPLVLFSLHSGIEIRVRLVYCADIAV